MAFAIIRTGGKQFRVEKGAKVRVPSINDEVGASVDLDVLVTTDGSSTKVGAPFVDGAKVTATVVDHGREPKIIVFKKRSKKTYKKTQGHRQNYTEIQIGTFSA